MPKPSLKSAYRTLRELRGKHDKQFEKSVLETELDNEWSRLDEQQKGNDALLSKRGEAVGLIESGDYRKAGQAIIGLRDAITHHKATTNLASELKGLAANAEDASDLARQRPHGAKPVLATQRERAKWDGPTDDYARDRERLKDAKEPEGVRRGLSPNETPDGGQGSKNKKLPVIPASKLKFGKIINNNPHSPRYEDIYLDGVKYKNPEFLGRGTFGEAFMLTSDKGDSIAVKYIGFYDETAVANMERLMQGPKDAVGRNNVMLAQMQENGEGLLAVMDVAAGDLEYAKQALNGAGNSGALPEEARNVLNQFMMKQALEGLCYIRDQGMTHYDLKEPNILIMADGTVKIGDLDGGKLDAAPKSNTELGTTTGLYSEYSHNNSINHGKIQLEAEANKTDTYTMGLIMKLMHRGKKSVEKVEGEEGHEVIYNIFTEKTVDGKKLKIIGGERYIDDSDKIKTDGNKKDSDNEKTKREPYKGEVIVEVADEKLTGALKNVYQAMTDASAAKRPVLEAVLDSNYIRNVDNYDPQTVRELMSANLAYGKAINSMDEGSRDAKKLQADIKAKRQEIAELDKDSDEAKERKRELDKLEAKMGPHKVHLDKIREISRRMLGGN